MSVSSQCCENLTFVHLTSVTRHCLFFLSASDFSVQPPMGKKEKKRKKKRERRNCPLLKSVQQECQNNEVSHHWERHSIW